MSYPTRPKFFSHRFCRLLTTACVANELGPVVCWLCTVIVHQEDARGYRGPGVTYFNEQLLPLVGLGSVDALDRVRRKAVDAGWLHYAPGGRGRPGCYWVCIPPGVGTADGFPATESKALKLRKNAEVIAEDSAEQTAEVSAEDVIPATDSPRDVPHQCGDNREESAEPSSLTQNTQPKDKEEAAAPLRREVAQQSAPKATKAPSLHGEFIKFFTEQWTQAHAGEKYPFALGKDGQAVKRLLGVLGDDRKKWRAVLDRYFSETADFFRGHTIAKLGSQIAAFLTDNPREFLRVRSGEVYGTTTRVVGGDIPPAEVSRLNGKPKGAA